MNSKLRKAILMMNVEDNSKFSAVFTGDDDYSNTGTGMTPDLAIKECVARHVEFLSFEELKGKEDGDWMYLGKVFCQYTVGMLVEDRLPTTLWTCRAREMTEEEISTTVSDACMFEHLDTTEEFDAGLDKALFECMSNYFIEHGDPLIGHLKDFGEDVKTVPVYWQVGSLSTWVDGSKAEVNAPKFSLGDESKSPSVYKLVAEELKRQSEQP